MEPLNQEAKRTEGRIYAKKGTPRPSTKINHRSKCKHKIITLTEDSICMYSGPLRKAEVFLSANRITPLQVCFVPVSVTICDFRLLPSYPLCSLFPGVLPVAASLLCMPWFRNGTNLFIL